jgi:hypothetical protein
MSLHQGSSLETVDPDLQGDSRWELVQRVAASAQFRRSERLREFLLYVAARSLTDRADEVTEPQIGIHVFHRRPGYNYSEDNIVRSHARLLRLKLESYFSDEGRDEPVVIRIPKGAYVPVFAPRETHPATVRLEKAFPAAAAKRPNLIYLLTVAVAVLGVLCAWLAIRQRAPAVAVQPVAPPNPLWSRIFDAERRALIVVSDHAFAMNQEALGRSLSLEDYLSPAYRSGQLTDPRLEQMIHWFVGRHYTLLSDVTAVAQLMRLPEVAPERVSIRYARDLTMREILSGNAVLLGGSDVNPWRELYEPQLNFVQVWDHATHRNHFLNRLPQPGEQSLYEVQYGRNQYGGLAFVPNLNQSGEVLLVFGTAMAGVEATMEFLINSTMSGKFYERLTAEAGTSDLPHFEVLLNTATVTNTSTEIPIEPTIVGYRLIR